jgi:hypothetical protein
MKTSIYAVLVLVLFSVETFAAKKCEFLFMSRLEFDRGYNAIKLTVEQSEKFLQSTFPDQKRGSTTGDRAEYKFTLGKEALQNIFEQFKLTIEKRISGFQLANRDPITTGFRNVTLTKYSNRFKLKLASGQTITAKIRTRKYGFISEELQINKLNFKPIKNMQDVSFFEFKIENPQHENSVLKPRFMIKDDDAEALKNPKITAQDIKEIELRCIDLNKMKTDQEQSAQNETIRLMLNALLGLHEQGSVYKEEYETIYERISYKIPLKSKSTGEVYEVQMTFDENISVKSNYFDYLARIYENQDQTVSVAEVKVPLKLLQDLNNQKFDQVLGLQEIAQFLKQLHLSHLFAFVENHGKLYHLRRDLFNEIDFANK